MSRYYLLIVIFIFLADSKWEFDPAYPLIIENPPSEIVGQEDLMGRYAYDQLMLSNPASGQVPQGIREAEIQFTRDLMQSTARLRTQSLDVESAGPFNVGGRTRAVAFDVRDENTIIAGGVSGGIWKSIDGGGSWVRTSDPLNRNSVTCIAQDTRPGREDVWYHGTGEIVGNSARGGGAPFRGNGIYKSIDNGESWSVLSATQDSDPSVFNSQFQYIWSIVVNDKNFDEDEVLVAAYGGILRSADGGETWEAEIGQPLFDLVDTVDLNNSNASFYTSLEQAENGIFYATLSSESSSDVASADAGIYLSNDGKEWVEVTPFTPESEYRRIVIGNSRSDPRVSYFLVDANPILIVYHQLDQFDGVAATQTFEAREVPDFEGDLGAFNTQGSYNMMIRVHPENPEIVFAGGTNLYRSTDGFRTKENTDWIGGYNPSGGVSLYPDHHPDQHDILFYPSDPNMVLSASDGGLIVSEDGTADSVMWKSINNGFVTSQFFTIAQSQQAGDPTLIGGMQDNGTDLTSASGVSNWQGITGGDGAYAATTKDNVLWFSSFQRGQTLRLTLKEDFSLSSFARVDPAGLVAEAQSAYLFVNPFALDPNNQNRMFMAGGNHLYFNANVSQIPGGSQQANSLGWTQVSPEPLEGGLYTTVDVSYNSKVAYAGSSNGKLLKIANADDQVAFEVSELTSALFPADGYVSNVSINPEDSDHLLVIFSNYGVRSIFESRDGGASFLDVSGNLEENVDGTGNGPSIRWAEIIPTNSGLLYLVGTSTGLFSSESTQEVSTVWVKESPDVIGNAVITMMDYRSSDGRLAIATHGNGVFTTTLSNFKTVDFRESGAAFDINYGAPNPFSDKAIINYTIPEDGEVRIDVFSEKGQLINNLLWAPQYAGTNEVTWEGTNSSGTGLSNGIYFYRIQYDGQVKTGKLILRR